MAEYPYAIEMPFADRNLSEIILSERLAEEPLEGHGELARGACAHWFHRGCLE